MTSEVASQTGPAILIVEDEEFDAFNVRRALAKAGHQGRVDWAKSLRAARAQMAARAYDVFLVDHRLPDGMGALFAAEVRAAPGGDAATVVMITSEPHEAVAAMEGGDPPWNGFIDKDDFSRNELAAAVFGEDAITRRAVDPRRCEAMLNALASKDPFAALSTVDRVQADVWTRVGGSSG